MSEAKFAKFIVENSVVRELMGFSCLTSPGQSSIRPVNHVCQWWYITMLSACIDSILFFYNYLRLFFPSSPVCFLSASQCVCLNFVGPILARGNPFLLLNIERLFDLACSIRCVHTSTVRHMLQAEKTSGLPNASFLMLTIPYHFF